MKSNTDITKKYTCTITKKDNKSMTTSDLTIFFLVSILYFNSYCQENQNSDYIEFNDRKNILHGVYLGIDMGYGQVYDGIHVGIVGAKLAYVANKKMELGFTLRGFRSIDKGNSRLADVDSELFSVYGGLHIENIILNESKFKISFPALMGLAYVQVDKEVFTHNKQLVPVIEPGINTLFNVNKYIQLEAGIKYRYSTRINLAPSEILKNINGFSLGIGCKIGVFNLGENRYKKQVKP